MSLYHCSNVFDSRHATVMDARVVGCLPQVARLPGTVTFRTLKVLDLCHMWLEMRMERRLFSPLISKTSLDQRLDHEKLSLLSEVRRNNCNEGKANRLPQSHSVLSPNEVFADKHTNGVDKVSRTFHSIFKRFTRSSRSADSAHPTLRSSLISLVMS